MNICVFKFDAPLFGKRLIVVAGIGVKEVGYSHALFTKTSNWAVVTVEDPSDNVHLIKHYYDGWIFVVSLVTVNVCEIYLDIEA